MKTIWTLQKTITTKHIVLPLAKGWVPLNILPFPPLPCSKLHLRGFGEIVFRRK